MGAPERCHEAGRREAGPRPPLTVERCRAVLGPDYADGYTDEEIERLRDVLLAVARLDLAVHTAALVPAAAHGAAAE